MEHLKEIGLWLLYITLIPSFSQSLIVRPIVLGVPSPLSRDREQNEALMIQGEMVSDLLHPLDTRKSTEPGRIHQGY